MGVLCAAALGCAARCSACYTLWHVQADGSGVGGSMQPQPDDGTGVGAHFDVFVSHHSADKPTVERLARALQERGLIPWLDAWELTPGGDWQTELAVGLRASRACAVFIGPQGAGAWSAMEA